MLLWLGGGELLWRGTLEYAQRRTSGAWAPRALSRLAMPLAWLLLALLWPNLPLYLWLFLGMLEVYLLYATPEKGLPLWHPHVVAHEAFHAEARHGAKRWLLLLALAAPSAFLEVYLGPLGLRAGLLLILPLCYHGLCWRQEYACDLAAAREAGLEQAREALGLLAHANSQRSALYALQYSAHPPARRRLMRLEGTFV